MPNVDRGVKFLTLRIRSTALLTQIVRRPMNRMRSRSVRRSVTFTSRNCV